MRTKPILLLLPVFFFASLFMHAGEKNHYLTVVFAIVNECDSANTVVKGNIMSTVPNGIKFDGVPKFFKIKEGKSAVRIRLDTSKNHRTVITFKQQCPRGTFAFQAIVWPTFCDFSKDHTMSVNVNIKEPGEVYTCISWDAKATKFKEYPMGLNGACNTAPPAPTLVDVKAKLLIKKKDEKKPSGFANQNMLLQDAGGKTVKSSKTDVYGNFSFMQVDNNKPYSIVLENADKIPANTELFIAKCNGTILASMTKDGKKNTFNYELLPPITSKLCAITEDDPSLLVKKFESSADKEITVVQNIYYASNSALVTGMETEKLETIAIILLESPSLLLEISAYTDSKGDDNYNMTLSKKRAKGVADYMASKGIDKKRLTGKGFGETKILNKCANGVECTEEEHELNRRTEFKFIKTK